MTNDNVGVNVESNSHILHTADITADEDSDSFKKMKNLRLKNPKNVIIAYLNINSVRNKFETFSHMMKN